MIPKFPEFKKLELSDREEIEKYTKQYPPYSDFNFTSVWAWDTNGKNMISELNGNLVVRFTDYETNEPLLSFIGTNETERTACNLIQYAKDSGISPILRLIPEESVAEMRTTALIIEEDKDNFDYIFSVAELATFKGLKFKEKRHLAHRFLREHPEARFEIKDLSDTAVQEQIVSVLRSWENNKKSEQKTYELQNEETAIKRLFETVTSHKLILSVIVADDAVRAFSIDEIMPEYCIGHFWQADITYTGVYDFFVQSLALYLKTKGIAFWNWEQDLGIEGLRESKMGYRPVNFLKKYKVSLA